MYDCVQQKGRRISSQSLTSEKRHDSMAGRCDLSALSLQ